MNNKARNAIFITTAVLLAACGTSTPLPTQTPLPAPTRLFTATVTISPSPPPTATATVTATHTPAPTMTASPTATPESAYLPMPEGEPAAEWQGIPVMPGAIAGEDNSGSYLFTIRASAEEIQAYYEKELRKLGWNLLGVGKGETANVLLIFVKEAETLSFAIIDPGTGDEVVQVLLVK